MARKTSIAPERLREFKERSEELPRITKILSQLQQKTIEQGLTIEERSLALKYETRLNKWVNEEYPLDWLASGGVQDYMMAEDLYPIARALRKGDIAF